MEDANVSNALLSSGLQFDTAKIFACLIFGAIGITALRYGMKNRLWRPTVVGLALLVYPYFVSGAMLIYLIGIVLTVALYLWQEYDGE